MSNISYNEKKKQYKDRHGNIATLTLWGTKKAARKALASNRKCKGCVDCHNCIGCACCTNCVDCTDCTDCSYCKVCKDCLNCSDCFRVSTSIKSQRLENCSDCIHCRHCDHCDQCHLCTTCSNCIACSSCWSVEGRTGIHDLIDIVEPDTCVLAGTLGQYRYWLTPNLARIGCQIHTLEEWRGYKKEDLCNITSDADEWYQRYWKLWLMMLDTVTREENGTQNSKN